MRCDCAVLQSDAEGPSSALALLHSKDYSSENTVLSLYIHIYAYHLPLRVLILHCSETDFFWPSTIRLKLSHILFNNIHNCCVFQFEGHYYVFSIHLEHSNELNRGTKKKKEKEAVHRGKSAIATKSKKKKVFVFLDRGVCAIKVFLMGFESYIYIFASCGKTIY